MCADRMKNAHASFCKGCKGMAFPSPPAQPGDTLEHVPVAVSGFLGSVVSWDYKDEDATGQHQADLPASVSKEHFWPLLH